MWVALNLIVSIWGLPNYSACSSLNVPTIVEGVGGWEDVLAVSFSTAFGLTGSYLSGTVYF